MGWSLCLDDFDLMNAGEEGGEDGGVFGGGGDEAINVFDPGKEIGGFASQFAVIAEEDAFVGERNEGSF